MKRLPSNLNADDLRAYRRQTGGLYLSCHHRRGCPHFREPAVERNPDGAPERLINIYRWSGSSQACHQAVAALG
jgi:hypothetical protein